MRLNASLGILRRKWASLVVGFILVAMIGGLLANLLDLLGQGGRVNSLKVEVTSLEKENEELMEKVRETESQGFDEKEIRDKLGLAKPGEAVVVIPEEMLRKGVGEFDEREFEFDEMVWKKWAALFF